MQICRGQQQRRDKGRRGLVLMAEVMVEVVIVRGVCVTVEGLLPVRLPGNRALANRLRQCGRHHRGHRCDGAEGEMAATRPLVPGFDVDRVVGGVRKGDDGCAGAKYVTVGRESAAYLFEEPSEDDQSASGSNSPDSPAGLGAAGGRRGGSARNVCGCKDLHPNKVR
jgi:hypothetical protein